MEFKSVIPRGRHRALFPLGAFLLGADLAFSQNTNSAPSPTALPDMGFSLLRVFGSLILVLALFLAGIWLFKNWQRLALPKGRSPKLSILEVKPLGGRHALYLVAYEQQRFLISSSPTGINLLTHLPEADTAEVLQPIPTFTQTLQRVLASKS
ncbi:MAG TPA: flagellar biosynthetic protein FliO [Verrucomicrobiae bacterium]|jgi:flagellar biogenesis protein FliO